MTSPISASLFATCVLKEKITRYDVMSLVCSFTGVIIIINPFSSNSTQIPTTNEAAKEYNYVKGGLFGIMASFFGGLIALCMRHMRDGIHYSLSPFWLSIACTIHAPIMHSLTTTSSNEAKMVKTTVYDNKTILYIGLLSLFSFVGQNFLSRSF